MQSFNKKYLRTIFALAAALLMMRQPTVLAEAPQTPPVSLSVAPAIIDVGGTAGSRVPFTFTVTNRSKFVLPFHMGSRSMSGPGGSTDTFLLTNNAQPWLEFTDPDFLLGSEQSKPVAGTLNIPANAGPGGHYADIIVRPLSQIDGSDTVHTQPELTVRLLVRVAGKTTERVEARPEGSRLIMTSKPSAQKVSFTFENSGNVHELTLPSLHIRQGTKDVAVVDNQPLLLLPREKRLVVFDLPDHLRFGIYSMSVTYTYASPPKSVTAAGYRLVIIPLSAAFLLLIPVGFGLYLAWRYRNRLLLAAHIIMKGRPRT